MFCSNIGERHGKFAKYRIGRTEFKCNLMSYQDTLAVHEMYAPGVKIESEISLTSLKITTKYIFKALKQKFLKLFR